MNQLGAQLNHLPWSFLKICSLNIIFGPVIYELKAKDARHPDASFLMYNLKGKRDVCIISCSSLSAFKQSLCKYLFNSQLQLALFILVITCILFIFILQSFRGNSSAQNETAGCTNNYKVVLHDRLNYSSYLISINK